MIDPATRALTIQFDVDNRAGQLLIGQSGTALLYGAATTRVPAVPKGAVLTEAGRPYVFVQVGGETFARRFVTVSAREGDLVGPRLRCVCRRTRRHAGRLRNPARLRGQGTARGRPRALRPPMKRIIQWSIDHNWLVITLAVLLLARRRLDGAADARGRLPRPHRAHRDHPHRRPRHGARGDGIARRRCRSRARSTAPRASGACASATAVGIAVVVGRVRLGHEHLPPRGSSCRRS